MEYKERDELVLDLGSRILDDADNIRLFMPDHYGKFWFVWRKQRFKVEICLDPEESA